MKRHQKRLLIFPIRRRLMGATVFFLCGVYLAPHTAIPPHRCVLVCIPLLLAGAWRCRKKQSAFFFACAVMLLLGQALTVRAFSVRDTPTAAGAALCGTVTAIEHDNRVYLSNVTVEGGPSPRHPVLVTLMQEEGEEREAARVGQRIRGKGRLFAPQAQRNPGGVDERIQALAEGYELSGYILPGWEAEGEAVFSLREWIRTVREALLAHIERIFGRQAPLYQGILLGERGEMDAQVVAAMRLTGTVHILTVSGMHLSFLAMGIARALRRLPLGRFARFFWQAALLIFFTCLTGGSPGTLRALIMAMLRAWAVFRGRRYDSLTALSAAAGILALCNPPVAMTASFQFSFLVVLGIVLLANGVNAWLIRHVSCARRFSGAAAAVSVSLCAQTAAIPMQLLLYGYVPVFSLPMNLITGMLMPVLMTGGLLCTAVGAVCPALGQGCAALLALPAVFFEWLSLLVSDWPGGIWRLPAIPAWTLPLCALVMALASPAIRLGRGRRRAAAACLLVLAGSYLPRLNLAARYVQLDVGQGDAALLRSGRHAVMVDVGPKDRYDAMRYIRHEGLFLDAVILSHLDEDHAGALGTLLRSEVDVGRIILAERAQEDVGSQAVLDALDLARQKKVPVEYVTAGDRIQAAGVCFDVLSPDESLRGSNERSLALFSRTEDCALLLTGDLPLDSEMEDPPDCDVLKVAHHGSKNATSRRFLEETTPSIAIISVGAGNRYGHPAERVLEDLEDAGAALYRTDEAGCITLWLGKDDIRVKTYLNPPSSNGR